MVSRVQQTTVHLNEGGPTLHILGAVSLPRCIHHSCQNANVNGSIRGRDSLSVCACARPPHHTHTRTHTQTHIHTRHTVFTYGLGRRLRASLVGRLSRHARRACRCSIQCILSCSRVRDCVSVVFLRFIKPHQLVIRAWVWFEFGDTQLSEGVEGLG